MGGVQHTIEKGFGATKKVLSGKGNFKDFGEMATGMDFTHAKDAPGPDLSTSPAQLLAQTGGAPLLANIAMGADVDSAIASYFGQSDFNSWYNGTGETTTKTNGGIEQVTPASPGLDPDMKKLVDGVRTQLKTIQSNTNLRNQAVQQIVNDFPNIAQQAAQARKASGEEFDTVTKGAIDYALNSNAAKYAANGALSSGAMAAATARVGAQNGMNKLTYMDSGEDRAYNIGFQNWQARYIEANALRNFQNLMTQGAAGQGFSAQQSALARNNQTQLTQLGYMNQNNMSDKAQQNAMYTGLGSLAGTAIGAYYGGPAGAKAGSVVGEEAGSELGGGQSTTNPKLNLRSGYDQPRYF